MSKDIAAMFGKSARREIDYNHVGWVLPNQYMGIEVEAEHTTGFRPPEIVSGLWVTKGDGSLQNGREYVLTTPLKGNQLTKAITELFHGANFERKTTGSTHIHVDMLEETTNADTVRKMILLIFMLESALFALGDPSREWCGYTNRLCTAPDKLLGAAFCETDTAELEFTNMCMDAANIGRYYGLNLQALSKFGSLEFRYFPTATSLDELTDWVQLVQSFKKAASEIKDIAYLEEMVSRPDYYAKLINTYFAKWAEVFLDTVPQYAAKAYFDKAMAVAKAYRHRYSDTYNYDFDGKAILENRALKKFVKKPSKAAAKPMYIIVPSDKALPSATKHQNGILLLCASGFYINHNFSWTPLRPGMIGQLDTDELELLSAQAAAILTINMEANFEIAGLGARDSQIVMRHLTDCAVRATTDLATATQEQQRQHMEEAPPVPTGHRGPTIRRELNYLDTVTYNTVTAGRGGVAAAEMPAQPARRPVAQDTWFAEPEARVIRVAAPAPPAAPTRAQRAAINPYMYRGTITAATPLTVAQLRERDAMQELMDRLHTEDEI